MDDLARRVAQLEAAEEIRRLKAVYAEVCDDRYDPERMVPLFERDAVWESDRFGTHRGIDEIYAFFAGVSADIVWALHYMVAPIVEVGGDLETATGRWYLMMPCTMRAGEGTEAAWLTGTYADRYRRGADGRWRFAHVKLTTECIAPYDAGWARVPFRDDAAGKR